MPGWIIQGVRGEGKSLAAVGKIKEYMQRGRPVATNLTLYLDAFLPDTNNVISYRLPDHPRLEDFQLLPPAYDPKYKAEDMNGLLVLDELGTWLNSRNWNDKKRLELLNWLFLSRKDHWDLILLAQDHEMIDAQVRTTLCDYLVQASRLDRQKIPYLGNLLKALGLNAMMPRVHRYHVYYGLSTNQPPVETWSYTGKDFYAGYDTNQKFLNGMEALNGTLIDMRATYTNIPAYYLTRRVFVDRLQQKIDSLRTDIKEEGTLAKKNLSTETSYLKIGLLSLALLIFIGWRVFSGTGLTPKTTPISTAEPVSTPPKPAPIAPASYTPTQTVNAPEPDTQGAQEAETFMDYLLKKYRPRLSVSAYHPDQGFFGNVDFYDNYVMVERYKIEALHSLGVALIHKSYGADLIYKGKVYILTAWLLPKDVEPALSTDTSLPTEPTTTSAPPVASASAVSSLLPSF